MPSKYCNACQLKVKANPIIPIPHLAQMVTINHGPYKGYRAQVQLVSERSMAVGLAVMVNRQVIPVYNVKWWNVTPV